VSLNNSESVHVMFNACGVMHVTFKPLMATTPGNDEVLLKHVGCMKNTINITGGSI
jgi:hypothetical protein